MDRSARTKHFFCWDVNDVLITITAVNFVVVINHEVLGWAAIHTGTLGSN